MQPDAGSSSTTPLDVLNGPTLTQPVHASLDGNTREKLLALRMQSTPSMPKARSNKAIHGVGMRTCSCRHGLAAPRRL